MGLLANWTPDLAYPRVWDVNLAELRDRGIRCLLLDLDNTLVPWRSYEIPGESVGFVLRAKSLGFKLCILSNAKGSRRLKIISEQLQIPFHRGILLNAKPCRVGYERCLRTFGSAPAQAAMIGDQIFTDIWGAKRMGILAVKVEPMSPKEFIGTKLSRLLEKLILKRQPLGGGATEG